MLLSELISHPYSSRYYLERYVNDGSPSGFSMVNTTKPNTSPFEFTSWFHPYICYAPIEYFKHYGDIPNIDISGANNWIIVHPDMIDNDFFNNEKFILKKLYEMKVIPTSSGRTVQILDKYNEDYIKLSYAGILGRIRRELPYYKAIAGPEISNYISKSISKKILNPKLSILPEQGARVLNNDRKDEWGMIWRKNEPLGLERNSYKFMFPSFSLFSMDRLNNHHYPLLKQIIDNFKYNPEDFVVNTILLPLIECYFDLILKLGLQAELNSQNLLFAFSEDFSSCYFVIRDLESIDKDITLMNHLGIDFRSDSYPYKCIDATQYNYAIKHSFMYDFKLGESILEPILNILSKFYNSDIVKLRYKISKFAQVFINELPSNFFPKDKWYVFDKVIVDQNKIDRPYIELDTPKFR